VNQSAFPVEKEVANHELTESGQLLAGMAVEDDPEDAIEVPRRQEEVGLPEGDFLLVAEAITGAQAIDIAGIENPAPPDLLAECLEQSALILLPPAVDVGLFLTNGVTLNLTMR
jgi:hypothetical protein